MKNTQSLANLPLDELLQTVARSKATGALVTVVETGDTVRTCALELRDGRICYRPGIVREIRRLLATADLDWQWVPREIQQQSKTADVQAVLFEIARANDEASR